jgi:hypothetical protein
MRSARKLITLSARRHSAPASPSTEIDEEAALLLLQDDPTVSPPDSHAATPEAVNATLARDESPARESSRRAAGSLQTTFVDVPPLPVERAQLERAQLERQPSTLEERTERATARPVMDELDKIKALTMHGMVEDIELPNGELKLLFLSNMQADLLSSRDDATDNILKALEVPSPQLVINLLTSHGFSEYVNKVGVLFPGATDAGLVTERASFASPEEERKAEERIDHFMADVYAALRKPRSSDSTRSCRNGRFATCATG